MRIIYLDEPTYLPDSFVREMEKLGEFEVYDDRPDEETAVRRLSAADIAMVEWTPLRARMFRQIRRLQYISLVMTSCDLVDLEAAGAAGIPVSNCPVYSAQSVAEHVFALLLAVHRKIIKADALVRKGGSHIYGPFLASELSGQTFGVIGTGRIGQAAARIARGFGMKVIGTNRSGRPAEGIELKGLQELVRESDVISLHVPANNSTEGLLTAELLASMKPSALLINTCRGRLVDEGALYTLLKEKRLAGAGLDDVTTVRHNPLYALDNVVFTPGTAWYTRTAREANMEELLGNIQSYVQGAVRNIVNGEFLDGK
ncbi:NAD(P)-dependent oxidoreductase [Paenibacillus filicis]|uniref:NAD(P)-dependent oxidoreductase n=1 Tax=Paenibacillus gyeongsangnamensis TaxID=3388067 RepID=A0ABT4QFZ5_9BACL|nr:NAD(P)-dependent oxidoreductase [Paenibacillus filicis]MCZ8515776.1 NAD(P)-dependent oxidoreductase [Paenibacillus filicis]